MAFPVDFPPELLAHILAQLSYDDVLFGAQRVCKGWKRMVESDPVLQTRMFRRASKVYVDVGLDEAEMVAGSEPVVFHPLVNVVSYRLGGVGAPRPCVYLHVKSLRLFAAAPGSGDDDDEKNDSHWHSKFFLPPDASAEDIAANAALMEELDNYDDDGFNINPTDQDNDELEAAYIMGGLDGNGNVNDDDDKNTDKWGELAAYAAADELATIPAVYTATLIAETEEDAEVPIEVENANGITVRDIFDALERAATQEVQTGEGPMPLHDAVHGGFYEGLTRVERKGRHLKAYIYFGS
ncbi:hypothetical protein MIND_01352300 [Mycena indigotica]|uniref:F-box domain-containing protein n=1 Tax=Mycena indigotica TaxID=2126181 RepID=A0A8H6S0S0_9AGAR|nr:uncharacterized protein MIND_01352300 [Mycena indigotica]KAF7289782.1 hypothetical protein MIND_01352300 [Mycena indigotica]